MLGLGPVEGRRRARTHNECRLVAGNSLLQVVNSCPLDAIRVCESQVVLNQSPQLGLVITRQKRQGRLISTNRILKVLPAIPRAPPLIRSTNVEPKLAFDGL